MTTKREKFMDALLDFLVGKEAEMSIKLQMGKAEALEWAKLRDATPLFGYYPGLEGRTKAKKQLSQMLGWEE